MRELTTSVIWGKLSALAAAGSVHIMWETVLGIWHDFLRNVPTMLGGMVIVALTAIIHGIFRRVALASLQRFNLKESQKTLVVRLSMIGIWAVGLLVALMIALPGLTPAKVLAGLGLGSIAIGFAFKDIFENFLAGILILWRFPFENGDYIKCLDIEGSVVDITIRNTLIRRISGELVVVPNSTLFKNPVDVLTNGPLRRTSVIAGVAYDEDVDAARQVIQKAVKACKTVAGEKPVQIYACEFAGSSINFEVAWWTGATPWDIRKSRDEVVAAVKKALNQADIEIPYPYRTLTFKQPLQLRRPPNNRQCRH